MAPEKWQRTSSMPMKDPSSSKACWLPGLYFLSLMGRKFTTEEHTIRPKSRSSMALHEQQPWWTSGDGGCTLRMSLLRLTPAQMDLKDPRC